MCIYARKCVVNACKCEQMRANAPIITSDMTYLPFSLLDVLHGDALDVHFVNFYVISASYEVRVGRACELALYRYVHLVVNFNADREFAGLGAETPCVARKSPNE